MPISYGPSSRARIAELDPRLQRLLRAYAAAVGKALDISVTCGHRGEAEQRAAFRAKPQRSRKDWPDSAHNRTPSLAVDIAPYPIDWEDEDRFLRVQAVIRTTARVENIALKPLISWDLPHVELDDGK